MAQDHVVALAPEGERGWLSVAEVAEALGVVPGTVYRLINGGRLCGYRIGRLIRVRSDDLDSYLESVRIVPGSLDHLCGSATAEEPEG